MIRRSPTRIELKLDDIQEFDYVHYDKKKTAQTAENAANISAATAAKLLRHERIGYHRAEGNMARRTGGPPLGNPTTTSVPGPETPAPVTTASSQPSSSAAATSVPVTGGVTATSTPLPASSAPATTEGTGAASESGITPANNLDPANLPSEIEAGDSIYMDLAEFNSTYASANMSMDET